MEERHENEESSSGQKSKMERKKHLNHPILCCCCCCSVAQLCPTLCDPMDCSTPGLPCPHHLPEFAQVHVHCIGDAIQHSKSILLRFSFTILRLLFFFTFTYSHHYKPWCEEGRGECDGDRGRAGGRTPRQGLGGGGGSESESRSVVSDSARPHGL